MPSDETVLIPPGQRAVPDSETGRHRFSWQNAVGHRGNGAHIYVGEISFAQRGSCCRSPRIRLHMDDASSEDLNACLSLLDSAGNPTLITERQPVPDVLSRRPDCSFHSEYR